MLEFTLVVLYQIGVLDCPGTCQLVLLRFCFQLFSFVCPKHSVCSDTFSLDLKYSKQ